MKTEITTKISNISHEYVITVRSPGIRTRHFTFEDERGSLAPAHTVMHSGVESNDNLSENSRAEGRRILECYA
eukprot:1389873-Amorphochlora_amoeboformis.AAC.1